MSLVVMLFKLQIINGENDLRTCLQIVTRELDIPGVRGNIYDRNENVLAYNELEDIWYTMGLTAYKKYEAIQIFSCISEITMVDILENSSQLPGVEVEETVIRRYNDSIYFPLLSDI